MCSNLLSIPEGACAEVRSMELTGTTRRRLLDLGFTPGARVTCLFAAPSGNPRAYMVRGSIIALRSSDAAGIAAVPIN
ncbi:MAG: ferrous iron transport protein A [Oscillospiraceae bacterium]